MKLTLKIWRQKNFETKGRIVNYQIDNISPVISRDVGCFECRFNFKR